MKARDIKQKMFKSYENAISVHKTMIVNIDVQHLKIRRMEHELKTYFGVEKKYNFEE